MHITILADADSVAREAARIIVAEARKAITERGRCIAAFSGGRTPQQMLQCLSGEQLSWTHIHILQVDERVMPEGDPDRNLTQLRESLLNHTSLPPEQLHAMPVEASDLKAAAAHYAATLRQLAGTPPVLDLVHLGLGTDGHTASLVPGDPVLAITNAEVAVTGIYQKRQRMTLTYPVLNRARCILWVVTGKEKAGMLARLCSGDVTIPAGKVCQEHALVCADRAAAAHLG